MASRKEVHMKQNDCVVYPFEENGCYFCYDAFSNTVFSLSLQHYKEIKKLLVIGREKYIERYANSLWGSPSRDIIYLLNTKNYFCERLFEKTEYPDMNVISGIYERSINDLALEVTEKCNFSCRYCRYATDNGISRVHENVNMSEDVATRAVDFLMEHSADANQVNIAFCGGEPLLNFLVIQKVIEYVDEKYPLKSTTYNLTCNASLLNDRIITFFELHNVMLMISFDGPENVQDYNRRFLINGEGTFQLVMKNVMSLMLNHKKYFKNNVTINAVHLNESQKNEAQNFFENLNITNQTRFVYANLKGIDFSNALNYNALNSSNKIDAKSVEKKQTSDWLKNYFRNIENKSMIPSCWHHSGPCIPGIRRLYVNSIGQFFSCEKIIHMPEVSIGSLNNGIDIEAALKLLNIGELTSEDCCHCIAFRFCSICCAPCVDPVSGFISESCKRTECMIQRKNFIAFLHEYVS